MSDQTCSKCQQPWELHEFGVPAPYCPGSLSTSEDHDYATYVEQTTKEFIAMYPNKEACVGSQPRFIAQNMLPLGVDDKNPQVQQIRRWCHEVVYGFPLPTTL